MKLKTKIVLVVSIIVLLVCIKTSSAGLTGEVGLDLNLNPLDINQGGNYSINVNNTEHFQGYTPTSLWSYYTGLGNALWYSIDNPFNFYNSTDFVISNYIPYTGATTDVDLGIYNLTTKRVTITEIYFGSELMVTIE